MSRAQQSAPEIRQRLARVTASRDRALRLYGNNDDRFREAEMRRRAVQIQLITCNATSTDGATFGPIARLINQRSRLIRDLVAEEAPEREIREEIRQAGEDIRREFLARLDVFADEQLDAEIAEIRQALTPQQLREGSGLNVDRTGQTVPAPSADPGVLRGGLGLAAILAAASGLIHIVGSRILGQREDARNEVVPEPTQAQRRRVRQRLSREPDGTVASRRDERKLTAITLSGDPASEIITAETPREAQQAVNQHFGTNGKRGIMQTLANEIRHEALRVAGNARDTAINLADDDIVLGYVLHSVFIATTDPEHAANDGNRYYKDSRSSSAAPWPERLIPPYRKNCLCFTQGLYRDEFGDEQFADFKIAALSGARQIVPDDVGGRIYDEDVGGLRTVTEEDVGNRVYSGNQVNSLCARDPGTWNRWFNLQPDRIKIQLMGRARFDAVVGRTGRKPRYYDFVDISGEILTAKQIREEGVGRRKIRTDAIQQIFRKLGQNHAEAWERGRGKWSLNQAEEDRFGRQLQTWLGGLNAQRGR